jgi:hypothetical protein
MMALFAWISYHQFMSTMSMDEMAGHQASPASCLTFCFIATKVDMSQLALSVYYSFSDTLGALLALLAISVVVYLALYYLGYNQSIINPLLHRLKRYYHQLRWKFKLFSLWSTLYQQGIIAPQIYS